MILALTIIQVLGLVLAQFLGVRTGALLTGFFGGLVSSTATTASLARKSKTSYKSDGSSEHLTFLSATGAMLLEGIALVVTGVTDVHIAHIFIFIGPILSIVIMITWHYHTLKNHPHAANKSSFELLPIIKLSLFIVGILTVSKFAQNIFGQNGLLVITSLVSLFEIHGAVIANVQLHESGAVTVVLLSGLLAISLVAACLSKLFLIASLGSPLLKRAAAKSTVVLIIAIALSWMAAINMP